MARSIVPATFCAARGLGNRHVQTLLPRLRPLAALERDVEILDLPDGDFVELAWVRPAPLADDAPLFVLFHGLEGSFDSPYARDLLGMASRLGWRALLMHYRGCGQAPNRLPRAYHSGDTADAYWLIGQLALRYPRATKVAAGVSLGGNMLAKLVAEQGGDGLDLAGAIVISAPLDLAASADALNSGFARFYQRHLLKTLRAKIAAKMASGPLPINLAASQLERLDSFWAYDNEVTAPLHGFTSASDYYHRASAGRLLGDIELPMLILHADDDPFMPSDLFSRLPMASDAVRIEVARQGGHAGFIETRGGRLHPWLVDRVGRQLRDWASLPTPARSATSRS
ncbi:MULTISPECIES: hydrolase [Halomonadaceae]|uniref:Hydrolase n=1 Tax=Modicisalibacter zincidurans TaxID=1178777 RepID=A0ABP9RJM1_9GAMM|nr:MULTISPECIES: hydrolase [Halomonas]MCD6006982.1 hydrolase [Halomonas sp. IOP_31]